jgi:hypothetical protein
MTEPMDTFEARLAASSPVVRSMLSEHLTYYDEFLSHVFMGVLVGWIGNLRAERPGDIGSAAEAAIAALEESYTTLDARVDYAIEASFLESFYHGQLPDSLLGPRLRSGLERVRSGNQGGTIAAMMSETGLANHDLSRLSVYNSNSEDCLVFMEPIGDDWKLPAGEHCDIHSPSIAAGRLEVGFSREGIVIALDPFDGWVVTDRSGNEVKRVEALNRPLGYDLD